MCETPENGKDEHPTPNVSSMSVFFLSMCSGGFAPPSFPFSLILKVNLQELVKRSLEAS